MPVLGHLRIDFDGLGLRRGFRADRDVDGEMLRHCNRFGFESQNESRRLEASAFETRLAGRCAFTD